MSRENLPQTVSQEITDETFSPNRLTSLNKVDCRICVKFYALFQSQYIESKRQTLKKANRLPA